MKFDPGFNIVPLMNPLGFEYGENCFGPSVENRTLDSIRKSLKDSNCKGPEIVYSIAMDVGKIEHQSVLKEKMLLYGAVTYAAGKLGNEPIRSQGHIHKKSKHSGWSPPEIYEIWTGKAIIYMQEFANDNPGKCYAVVAKAGEVVIVPPNWAHATISTDQTQPLTFGAWCDREYGFEYDKVRAHKGLAWFPLIDDDGKLTWYANQNYETSELIKKTPNDYSIFGIKKNESVYRTFEKDPNTFQYVSKPYLKEREWKTFIP